MLRQPLPGDASIWHTRLQHQCQLRRLGTSLHARNGGTLSGRRRSQPLQLLRANQGNSLYLLQSLRRQHSSHQLLHGLLLRHRGTH